MSYPDQLARYEADMNWQWSKYLADAYGAYSEYLVLRQPAGWFCAGEGSPGTWEPLRRRPAPSGHWTCSYCGGLRLAEAIRCDGCGASR